MGVVTTPNSLDEGLKIPTGYLKNQYRLKYRLDCTNVDTMSMIPELAMDTIVNCHDCHILTVNNLLTKLNK